jgi:hypothetical protein
MTGVVAAGYGTRDPDRVSLEAGWAAGCEAKDLKLRNLRFFAALRRLRMTGGRIVRALRRFSEVVVQRGKCATHSNLEGFHRSE